MQQRDPDDAAGDVQVPEVVGVADPTCRDVCESSAIWAAVAKARQDAEQAVPCSSQGNSAVRSAP